MSRVIDRRMKKQQDNVQACCHIPHLKSILLVMLAYLLLLHLPLQLPIQTMLGSRCESKFILHLTSRTPAKTPVVEEGGKSGNEASFRVKSYLTMLL